MFSFRRNCLETKQTVRRIRLTSPNGLCSLADTPRIEHHVLEVVQHILRRTLPGNGNASPTHS